MKNFRTTQKLGVLVLLLLLTGCAQAVDLAPSPELHKIVGDPPGFWSGLWHGIVCPFAWIGSLFSEKIAIYSAYNSGGWYDFGYILGLGFSIGGSSSSAR